LDASFYTYWIRWIINRAGDTDTNGAIAGGMLGSIIGFWNLPVDYVVTSLKTITDGRQLVIEDH
jgi:ADP-ribosylglycohydrolase